MQWDALTDQAAHKTLSRPPILIPQLSYKSLNHDGLRVEDRQHRTRRISEYLIPNLSRFDITKGGHAITPNGYWGSNDTFERRLLNHVYTKVICSGQESCKEKSRQFLYVWQLKISRVGLSNGR